MWKYLKVNIFLWLWPFPLVFPAPPKSIGPRRRYFLPPRRHPISNRLLYLPRHSFGRIGSFLLLLPGLPKPGQFRALGGGYLFSPATPGSLLENRLRRFPISRGSPSYRFASRKMNNLLTVFFLPFDLNHFDSFDSPSGLHLELPGKHIDQDPVVFYSAWTNYFVSSWQLHSHVYVLFLFSHQKDRFSFICEQIRLPNQIIKEQSSVSQMIWWVCSFSFSIRCEYK